MIKTADMLIDEAKLQISCLDIASAQALYERSEAKVILDVREAEAAEKSKLNDSLNIPRGLIEMKMPKLYTDPSTLILIHCAGGGRASLAAQSLQKMGYTNVHAIAAKFEDIKITFD
ncbi:rhodanese-like domain-containing protein [Shewanella surugensis]|uniref:Rhodanese-like domain-containing protein n=1 Tax=Shewanella surugensis TaxID=212020 RepID=A0ABT0L9V7_9GAMM|nr:rhodanese-like domain-containing protein [Shewanella surugensis]MCL1124344.1 rhodanese-like domain-containing protein [Shewanella surugensis]